MIVEIATTAEKSQVSELSLEVPKILPGLCFTCVMCFATRNVKTFPTMPNTQMNMKNPSIPTSKTLNSFSRSEKSSANVVGSIEVEEVFTI